MPVLYLGRTVLKGQCRRTGVDEAISRSLTQDTSLKKKKQRRLPIGRDQITELAEDNFELHAAGIECKVQ